MGYAYPPPETNRLRRLELTMKHLTCTHLSAGSSSHSSGWFLCLKLDRKYLDQSTSDVLRAPLVNVRLKFESFINLKTRIMGNYDDFYIDSSGSVACFKRSSSAGDMAWPPKTVATTVALAGVASVRLWDIRVGGFRPFRRRMRLVVSRPLKATIGRHRLTWRTTCQEEGGVDETPTVAYVAPSMAILGKLKTYEVGEPFLHILHSPQPWGTARSHAP